MIEFNPLNELFTIKSPAPDPALYAHPCIISETDCDTTLVSTDEETFRNKYYSDISPKNFYENFNSSISTADVPSNYTRFFGSTETTQSIRSMFNYFVARGLLAENNIISQWNQNCYLLINYIYLDTKERTRMAQQSHEYLITQVHRQVFQGLSGENNSIELKIQHPVKELVWAFQHEYVSYFNKWNTYTFDLLMRSYVNSDLSYQFYERIPTHNSINSFDSGYNIMYSGTLLINGHERFRRRDHLYFENVEPYLYHTGSTQKTANNTITDLGSSDEKLLKYEKESGIYVYSFALNPEEMQPSGSCNFSRVNKAEFHFDVRGGSANELGVKYDLYMFSYNVNVLRILGGLGGVVFSN